MKALISPNEQRTDYQGIVGARIAQVEQTTFEVAPPLFWVDCPENCVADVWWYYQDTCQPMPEPPPPVPTAEENKATAEQKYVATNWSVEPDAADPAYPPYLTNQSEFLTYRAWLRSFTINPQPGFIDWPVEPTPQWSE
jgi:hypothetical protein